MQLGRCDGVTRSCVLGCDCDPLCRQRDAQSECRPALSCCRVRLRAHVPPALARHARQIWMRQRDVRIIGARQEITHRARGHYGKATAFRLFCRCADRCRTRRWALRDRQCTKSLRRLDCNALGGLAVGNPLTYPILPKTEILGATLRGCRHNKSYDHQADAKNHTLQRNTPHTPANFSQPRLGRHAGFKIFRRFERVILYPAYKADLGLNAVETGK